MTFIRRPTERDSGDEIPGDYIFDYIVTHLKFTEARFHSFHLNRTVKYQRIKCWCVFNFQLGWKKPTTKLFCSSPAIALLSNARFRSRGPSLTQMFSRAERGLRWFWTTNNNNNFIAYVHIWEWCIIQWVTQASSEKGNPSIPIRSRSYDVPITSSDALRTHFYLFLINVHVFVFLPTSLTVYLGANIKIHARKLTRRISTESENTVKVNLAN